MALIDSLLQKRKLPALVSDRAEAISLLSDQIYGRTPEFSGSVSGEITKTEVCCGGAGTREHIVLSFDVPGGKFSFPTVLSSPNINYDRPPCLFIFLNFRPDIPDRYYPEEMLLRNNFAIARIFYKDVTSDSAERDGLAAHYPYDAPDSVGKIGLWAFAASRALDFCLSLGRKYDQLGVIGHSRLGKTALWAGAQDERFDFVCSNCSGCSGAAITRGKQGEQISDIVRVFPFWFCPRYAGYSGKTDELPFDQHHLLSLCAPRLLSVVSASNDLWADPESEYLACFAASPTWEEKGIPGFAAPDRLPFYNESFTGGSIGYYYREGNHALTDIDWKAHISFWNRHRKG